MILKTYAFPSKAVMNIIPWSFNTTSDGRVIFEFPFIFSVKVHIALPELENA